VTAQATPQITATITQQVTAQVTHQVVTLFNQVFDTARLALNTGIHASFVVGLGICAAVIVLTFFLKDVPLRKREVPGVAPAAQPVEGPGADQQPTLQPAIVE
jgi:hypothetical protein